MMHLRHYRLFLIDMDDTLFEERDFVLSGFHAAAAFMAQWAIDPEEAEAALRRRFAEAGRARIFDHVLRCFLGKADPESVQELVRIYREHTPRIALYPGAAERMRGLRRQGRVVVVTDGLPSVQARKAAALGLDRLADHVVYCWAANAPKPDPRALAGIVTAGDPEAVLIGDDPRRDLALAAALGIDAIRVRTGRFKDMPNTPWTPCADVESFSALMSPCGRGGLPESRPSDSAATPSRAVRGSPGRPGRGAFHFCGGSKVKECGHLKGHRVTSNDE